MSRLKSKKENKIHKLGGSQHIIGKDQMKEKKLFNKECMLFKPILTQYFLILKYQAHYEIFHLENFFINIGLITTVCQRVKFIQFQSSNC